MTESTPPQKPNNVFGALEQTLREATDRFLSKTDRLHADAVDATTDRVNMSDETRQDLEGVPKTNLKEKLREQSREVVDAVSQLPNMVDAFEQRLKRLKALRQTPSAAVIKEKIADASRSNDVSPVPPPVSSELPSSPRSPNVSPPPVHLAPPEDISKRLALLLTALTGKQHEPLGAYTWQDWDRMTSQLRNAWVQVLSSENIAKAQECLPAWIDVIDTIQDQSIHWGLHAQAWSEWAKQRAQESRVLAMWVERSSPVASALSVPSSYQNKGNVPSSVKGVPVNLQQQLKEAMDFLAFAQDQSSFVWKHTPQQQTWNTYYQSLEAWVPSGALQESWKEKALDCYTIGLSRLVLKATQPVSSHAPKKSHP